MPVTSQQEYKAKLLGPVSRAAERRKHTHAHQAQHTATKRQRPTHLSRTDESHLAVQSPTLRPELGQRAESETEEERGECVTGSPVGTKGLHRMPLGLSLPAPSPPASRVAHTGSDNTIRGKPQLWSSVVYCYRVYAEGACVRSILWWVVVVVSVRWRERKRGTKRCKLKVVSRTDPLQTMWS